MNTFYYTSLFIIVAGENAYEIPTTPENQLSSSIKEFANSIDENIFQTIENSLDAEPTPMSSSRTTKRKQRTSHKNTTTSSKHLQSKRTRLS